MRWLIPNCSMKYSMLYFLSSFQKSVYSVHCWLYKSRCSGQIDIDNDHFVQVIKLITEMSFVLVSLLFLLLDHSFVHVKRIMNCKAVQRSSSSLVSTRTKIRHLIYCYWTRSMKRNVFVMFSSTSIFCHCVVFICIIFFLTRFEWQWWKKWRKGECAKIFFRTSPWIFIIW